MIIIQKMLAKLFIMNFKHKTRQRENIFWKVAADFTVDIH